MKNILGRAKFFFKNIPGRAVFIPIISMFGYMTYSNNKQYMNYNQNRLFCNTQSIVDNQFTLKTPEITIIYNEHNDLQIEMTDMIIRKINDLKFENVLLRKLTYDKLCDYQKNLYKELQNQEETYSPRPARRPLTKFERRGQALGHGVWDVIFNRD